MNDTHSPDDLDALVRRFIEVDTLRADCQIEMDAIKAQLRELGLGAHAAPCGINVTVSPNRRFNAAKALEVVPAELLPAIQTTSIDAKKAKALLPPALYEAAMIAVGDPRVVIK